MPSMYENTDYSRYIPRGTISRTQVINSPTCLPPAVLSDAETVEAHVQTLALWAYHFLLKAESSQVLRKLRAQASAPEITHPHPKDGCP